MILNRSLNCQTDHILRVFTVLKIFRVVKELFSSTFFQNTVKVIFEDDILVGTIDNLLYVFFGS